MKMEANASIAEILSTPFFDKTKIKVKIPMQCHNHKAQPSRGIQGRRDEEKNDNTNTACKTTDVQAKKSYIRGITLEWSIGKIRRDGESLSQFTRGKPHP